MPFEPGSLHHVVLNTAGKAPLLTGKCLHIAEHAVETLQRRFPGLKVARKAFRPDTVLFLLDFSRCDEDIGRVVQSYKTEVRKLSSQVGFKGEHFWQREHDEKVVESREEFESLRALWNL